MSYININACRKENSKIIALSKITLAPLALLNILINTNFNQNIKSLIIIAFTFYLVGDILLLSKKKLLFTLGLSSFLLGHIVFIFIFNLFNKSYLTLIVAFIILLYPEIQMFRITKSAKKLKTPMRIYSLFMAIFIAFSTTTYNILLIFATSIFTLSDSFIAKNTCSNIKKYNESHIMITYSIALIALSLSMVILNY